MKNAFVKKLGVILLASMFGFGSMAVMAAENAAGVAKYTEESIKTTKEALDHAKQGHKDETASSIKIARQAMKEVTGDPVGMNIQRANSRLKEANAAAEKGDTAKAAELLEDALKEMDTIQKYVKSR